MWLCDGWLPAGVKPQYVCKTRNAVDLNGNSRGVKSVAQVSEHISLSSLCNCKTNKKINKKNQSSAILSMCT